MMVCKYEILDQCSQNTISNYEIRYDSMNVTDRVLPILVRVVVQPLILVPHHIWIRTPLLVIVLSVVLGGGSKEHHHWSSSIAEDCLFTDELKQ